MNAPRAQVAPGDRIDGRYDLEDLLGAGGTRTWRCDRLREVGVKP